MKLNLEIISLQIMTETRKKEVTNLNGDEKQVCIDSGQEFWYETEQLSGNSFE